jgi:hypothetical protein
LKTSIPHGVVILASEPDDMLIIVKNLENTFLGMKKVRAWPILTLAMPYVKTEQIQNLALF